MYIYFLTVQTYFVPSSEANRPDGNLTFCNYKNRQIPRRDPKHKNALCMFIRNFFTDNNLNFL